MSRTAAFRRMVRAFHIAKLAERLGISSAEAIATFDGKPESGRRKFIQDSGKWIAATTVASAVSPWRLAMAAATRSQQTVGIVGAGLAGLSCAYELKKAGVRASLYEAADRAGGRCWSLRGFFPGQTAERGGELIDNLHKTMLGYAKEFGLPIEDVNKDPGEVFYYFGGVRYPESVVIDQFREFVTIMQDDLRKLSGDVDASNFTPEARRIDLISLEDYLLGNNSAGIPAGYVAYHTIKTAYTIEYGRETGEQSCLNLLMFIHADKRSKFAPWGVFSDERWHVVSGNDGIVTGLASRIDGQIKLGQRLVRVRKTSGGRIELTFTSGKSTVTQAHDIVLLTLPFTVLRGVELDPNLELPEWKTNAIQRMGYGTNAKMMIGFDARPWDALGCNGVSYSDLPNHQSVWPTNPSLSTPTRAILTDYSGGRRGAALDPSRPQREAEKFLTDLDRIIPGAKAAASRVSAGYRVHLEHWPSNPNSLGSYTAYEPGQFTSIAGLEGKPVGNLHFAGEHTDSFYSWQGFMEGAALSGLREAAAILAKLR